MLGNLHTFDNSKMPLYALPFSRQIYQVQFPEGGAKVELAVPDNCAVAYVISGTPSVPFYVSPNSEFNMPTVSTFSKTSAECMKQGIQLRGLGIAKEDEVTKLYFLAPALCDLTVSFF